MYDDGSEECCHLDMDTVARAVREITGVDGCPRGFSLDFGILEDTGKTVLIEMNDGWALGLYRAEKDAPFDSRDYARLLHTRWTQMRLDPPSPLPQIADSRVVSLVSRVRRAG